MSIKFSNIKCDIDTMEKIYIKLTISKFPNKYQLPKFEVKLM